MQTNLFDNDLDGDVNADEYWENSEIDEFSNGEERHHFYNDVTATVDMIERRKMPEELYKGIVAAAEEVQRRTDMLAELFGEEGISTSHAYYIC
ncbi:TPA: hypothetical protein HA278_00230, partial [Candidatus Woesearchaeota archaeon]|nr:hypothetical protein [Candidatus Woesearchaeota archaeon]